MKRRGFFGLVATVMAVPAVRAVSKAVNIIEPEIRMSASKPGVDIKVEAGRDQMAPGRGYFAVIGNTSSTVLPFIPWEHQRLVLFNDVDEAWREHESQLRATRQEYKVNS